MTIIPPPEPDPAALQHSLSRLRAQRGWSYDQLAAHSGLSRRTLIEIEQGRTIGTLATWHALAHAFHIPLGELLDPLCMGHEPPGPAD
ncbi:putative transcriptional regulator [Streptomyces sp. SAI-117]|uniref:helix-turn-helix transcriptional regulator n=1 Tax=Streptomyces sp. SAI-117 TaxID=2940546 RepID=UPI002473FA2C|nr:helix-turn-helix transcriptional regulator [Streptomyces sp. SAI-117]MDH6570423.1 putative transcriptional regulator [Streptomyces sp. SAI-117]